MPVVALSHLLLIIVARAEEPGIHYNWLVKDNKAIGCIERVHVQNKKLPGCYDLPFAVYDCAIFEAKYLIENIQTCISKIPTKPRWLEDEKPPQCVEFAEYEDASKTPSKTPPKTIRALVSYAPPERCGHRWVRSSADCKYGESGQYAFHPLSKMGIDQLIPEIMNLASGQTIPESVYKKYDSERIGMTLVYRKHKMDEENIAAAVKKDKAFNYLEDTEIKMAFRHELIDSIFQKGFLNQHQINQSKGCLCPDRRAQIEDRVMGAKLVDAYVTPDSPVNEVRPKYSFHAYPTIPERDKNPLMRLSRNYGDVIAVFQAKVKDRATFTYDDSLDYDAERSTTRTFRFRSDSDPIAYKKGRSYSEAQVWGKLTKEDVAYFLVNCHNPLPAETIAKLKSSGRKVFDCVSTRNDIGDTINVKAGAEL